MRSCICIVPTTGGCLQALVKTISIAEKDGCQSGEKELGPLRQIRVLHRLGYLTSRLRNGVMFPTTKSHFNLHHPQTVLQQYD